jgi:hypothetical protein
MFYEDFRIGQSADLGETTFSREAILAYGQLITTIHANRSVCY